MDGKLLENLPWRKVTAPMIPIILVDLILSSFIKAIYAINVANGIQSQSMIYAFLIGNGVIISVYLFLSVTGNNSQEEINSIRKAENY